MRALLLLITDKTARGPTADITVTQRSIFLFFVPCGETIDEIEQLGAKTLGTSSTRMASTVVLELCRPLGERSGRSSMCFVFACTSRVLTVKLIVIT